MHAQAAAAHKGGIPLLGGSGTVTAVGSDVQSVHVGDKVMVLDPRLLATRAVVQSHQLAVIPGHLSLQDAASLSVGFPVAVYALFYAANLQEGQSILIQSAGDGVALAAMQVSQSLGAKVCSFLHAPSSRTDMCRSTAQSRMTKKPTS